MSDLAEFMIDFEIENADELEMIYAGYETSYILAGADEKRPIAGSPHYSYTLQIAKACYEKIKRLPKRSRCGGDSWETLLNWYIPDILFERACIETAEIDNYAKKLGMTRTQLIEQKLICYKYYANKYIRHGKPCRVLSLKCVKHSHKILQRIVAELERLGFGADYQIYTSDIYHKCAGVFFLGTKEHCLTKACDAGILPAVTYRREDIQLDEYEISYEHPEGEKDEKPIFAALSVMADWADKLKAYSKEDLVDF
ncbi:MAG: hypothetical protein LBI19_10900 [Oscillospiraceae bacterium]|jgi:hypothetical protein|nr:hypothetical protein [Oscillospiraceae bacterium]